MPLKLPAFLLYSEMPLCRNFFNFQPVCQTSSSTLLKDDLPIMYITLEELLPSTCLKKLPCLLRNPEGFFAPAHGPNFYKDTKP